MKLTGTPDQILAAIRVDHPEVDEVLGRVRKRVPSKKREVAAYQAAALYALARPYNRPGAHFLEIGTFWGYSAAILAEAAPGASITTLNPRQDEVELARRHLKPYPNVVIKTLISWDYLSGYRGPLLDLIFVDGDHKHILRDLPWWEYLVPGGVMLFHDYSPAGTHRECPPVYEALNQWSQLMEHPFDVLVVDDGGVGFAGFYKGG